MLFFLKNEAKNFCHSERTDGGRRAPKYQKFFASFFKKDASSFPFP